MNVGVGITWRHKDGALGVGITWGHKDGALRTALLLLRFAW